MKRAIGHLIVGAILIFWMAPLATALLDGACWFWIAKQCTSVDWDQRRLAICVAWTVFVPLAFAALGGNL